MSSLTTTSRLQLLFEIYMWCLLLTYNLSEIELLWYTLSHSLCIKIPHRPFSSIGINAPAYSRPFHSNLHCIALTKFLKYLLPWTEYQCCSKVCRELWFQRMLRKFKWKIDRPPQFIGRVLRLSLIVTGIVTGIQIVTNGSPKILSVLIWCYQKGTSIFIQITWYKCLIS